MRRRAWLALLVPTALAACGLGVTGVDPENTPEVTNEGGVKLDGSSSSGNTTDGNVTHPDGTVPIDSGDDDDAMPDDSGTDADAADAADGDSGITDAGTDAKDSSADASDGAAEQLACLAVCPLAIGNCVGGVCTIKGTPMQPLTLVCPGTVPCHVICDSAMDCLNGVDCGQASSCKVDCTGDDTCKNGGVSCAGTSCDVTCSGMNACKDNVTCAAKTHCGIQCIGKAACSNNPPTCNVTNGDCTLNCGSTLGGVTDSCLAGASCTASTMCTMACQGMNCSKNARFRAVAPKTDVTCGDGATCHTGVYVEGQNATVFCGTGGACLPGDVQCKAKTCAASCNTSGTKLCCEGATSCSSTGTNACTPNDAGINNCP